MSKNSIVDLVKSASPKDLQAIDDEIAGLESQIAELQNQIQALRAIRKPIDIKLNGKPARKPRQKPTKPGEGAKLSDEIYDLLAKEGSMPSPAIAARLNRSPAAVGSAVHRSDWFTIKNGEVHIATT